MKVLVVIPTHDRTEFLEDALLSLDKQTKRADQVVVIGNVGPKENLTWVEYQHSDADLPERLNTTIKKSSCDAFIILCDDDRLEPTYIEKTTELMQKNNADISYTAYTYFGTKNDVIDSAFIPVTALCKKEAWERAGGYAAVPYFDWDFWWSCVDAGVSVVKTHESLFKYRRHSGQAWENDTAEMVSEYKSKVAARHTKPFPFGE